VTKRVPHEPRQHGRRLPMIGAPPAPEGPARFPTAYFGRRQEALDWLAG
jgi:hypothetical protein